MKFKECCCFVLLFYSMLTQAWDIKIVHCSDNTEYQLKMNDFGVCRWEGQEPPIDVGYLLQHIAAQAVSYINNGLEELLELLNSPELGEATLIPENKTIEAEIHAVKYNFNLLKGEGFKKKMVKSLPKDCPVGLTH